MFIIRERSSGLDALVNLPSFFCVLSVCRTNSRFKCRWITLQNRDGGDRQRGGGSGGDFQRSDSSPGSRPSSVLPDLLTSSPSQRQDKSTSEEVRYTFPSVTFFLCVDARAQIRTHLITFNTFDATWIAGDTCCSTYDTHVYVK